MLSSEKLPSATESPAMTVMRLRSFRLGALILLTSTEIGLKTSTVSSVSSTDHVRSGCTVTGEPLTVSSASWIGTCVTVPNTMTVGVLMKSPWAGPKMLTFGRVGPLHDINPQANGMSTSSRTSRMTFGFIVRCSLAPPLRG